MKKNSRSVRCSGAYTSPGTPEYGDNNVGEIPKSWSSERLPLPTSSTRPVGAAALIPFNSGRALPWKWDDAERWITSPISSYGSAKTSIPQPQRRPKSKSGPIAPAGLVYLSNYSPNITAFECRKVGNFMSNSPLTTGVLVPDALSIHYDARIGGKSISLCAENDITRGASVPGLSDLLSETSVPSSQDDKLNGAKVEEALDSQSVNHRDMATQMSPDRSTHSSSKGRLSFSNISSSVPTSFSQNANLAAKDEVRDVQVDKGTSTARKSKEESSKKTKDDATKAEDLSSPWNASEASKSKSKLQREEAKITAWENLQKSKAEAAIQKLEMKLEKKRSASMDKIMNKLRASQKKAQAMRDLLSKNHAPQAPATSYGLLGCVYVKPNIHSKCFLCCRN